MKKPIFLFALFFVLMLAGGLVEKVCAPAAVCLFVLALADIAVLTLGDRRGWF